MFFKKINEKLDMIIERQGENLEEYQLIMEEQARQIEEYQKILANNKVILETERQLNKELFENQESKIKEYQRICYRWTRKKDREVSKSYRRFQKYIGWC